METNKRAFYRGLTYDEWASQQDKENLEFRAINAYHKTHPGYNLEEIRGTMFAGIIESEESQKIFHDNFGQRHINSDKLNQQISKLCKILFSQSSEFKSIDKRGHGDTVTTKFGKGKNSESISFRIEEKAIKYARYLIDHKLVEKQGGYTVADLVRIGFVKYIEMVPIVNEIKDSVTDRFLLDMKVERENQEKAVVDDLLKGFEIGLDLKEQELMEALRHINNREELEEIRDWIVDFVKTAMFYDSPTKREKARIKEFMMRNSRLYNILTTFEREKLLSRGYIDSLYQKATVVDPLHPFSVESEDQTLTNDSRYKSLSEDHTGEARN